MQQVGCEHVDRNPAGRICIHLLEKKDVERHQDHFQRFTGTGVTYDLVCSGCAEESNLVDDRLAHVCSDCFQYIIENNHWAGILGSPEVLSRSSNLTFSHRDVDLPGLADVRVLAVEPIEGSDGVWLACTATGAIIEIDPIHHRTRFLAQIPRDSLDFDGQYICHTGLWEDRPSCVLRVSTHGQMAVVANRYGSRGVVLDLSRGKVTMNLHRDDYHEDVSSFPLAFCNLDDRVLLIHGTEWNRLDISDADTGKLLTRRRPTSYQSGEAKPPHYLDYFHCQLSVSPGQQFIVDDGWVWHPAGVLVAWDLPQWLHDNVWESEDGSSKRELSCKEYHWDGPLCWIDDRRLAVWGYGADGEWLIPAVSIYDVVTGKCEKWFAGPNKGSLTFDEYLFSFSEKEGTTVWDVKTGERVASEPGFCPAGYHRGGKHFLTILEGGRVRMSRLISQ